LRLQLKSPWADDSTAFVLHPLDFIARLVAAIPPPRFHLTRFHGVLAPNSTLPPHIVPRPQTAEAAAPLQLPLFTAATGAALKPAPPAAERDLDPRYTGRHPWALLLRHVFAAEVSLCDHCQGRMRLHELATTPDAIARAMAHAGLAPRPPPTPPPPVHASQLSLPLR
jgi:hypothetical protein